MMETIQGTLSVVTPHTASLGEGPLWVKDEKCILWLDILQKEIHRYYTETAAHKVLKLDHMPGAVVLREKGGVIAALDNGFAIIDLETGVIIPIADPEAEIDGNRFNDGKCDAAGRFWAGTMALSEQPHAGSLYVLESDHSVSVKIKGVTISNGIAWTEDNRTMYYIDTPTSTIVAFDIDIIKGEISNRHVVITVQAEDGYPDGMTIDTEGMLWVCCWAGWQVVRYDPATGMAISRIKLPVANVTSCTFGGEDMDDLYITTARKGISAEDLEEQPLAGSLFVVKNCGHKGCLPFKSLA